MALVTGGGTGIGREIARVLLAAGASVVITGRRQEVLEGTVASLSAEAEGRVASVVGDVGQEADAEEAVAPPPRRKRRPPRRRVVRLAPPPGIRPASAPKPWGHHRLVGGFFPPAPLEGRHGVSPAMVAKYR